MKTTIICPTDFSETAINATEYAAYLAQLIDAELMLVNVQQIMPIAAAVSLAESEASITQEKSIVVSKKLKAVSTEITKLFKIPTTYEVDITTKNLEKTISALSGKNTMIVMGTNGIDNLSQFFFGTNTYNVIKKANCPVLIIPENILFEKYKHILFPIINEKIERNVLDKFYEFIKHFDPELTFLYISKKDTIKSQNEFNNLKDEVENFFSDKGKLNFKKIFAENIDDAIDDFVAENPIDLMVAEAKHRNFLEIIFKEKPFLAKLSAIAPYPIFVVHT